MIDTFQEIGPGDSRYAMKQRDIAATISRMGEAQKRSRERWESELGDMLDGATEEAVLRGGGDRSILHASDRFRFNYENWIRSLNE
jgi:hypothetical protein